MCALVLVVMLDEDVQVNLFSAHRDESVSNTRKIARYECEQVSGFRERVMPFCKMPAVLKLAGADEVPVREQHRLLCLVSYDGREKPRHDVGTVGIVRDLAEPFRLAL